MAQRRMFSPDIVDSDAFLDMPTSSQVLYFHLAMRADDDGFVDPKKVMRLIGVGSDDLKVLLAKRFLLSFQNGVVVIKHWLIHNMIRKDRYKETRYLEEKKSLLIKENGSYTELATIGKPNGNQMAPQVRLGKVRLGKVTNTSDVPSQDIVSVIDSFKEINQAFSKWYKNTTQRESITRLIKNQSLEKVLKVIKLLPQTNVIPYMPTITTPVQLEDKWSQLESALIKKKNEMEVKKSNVI